MTLSSTCTFIASTMAAPKNSFTFKGTKGAAVPGVYAGASAGVTRTAPSKTLFITSLGGANPREVETLFQQEPGFVALRTVRHLIFVDFTDERSSSAAMRKHQGLKLSPANVGAKGAAASGNGLVIDFDKDASSERRKRDAASDAERDREAANRRALLLTMDAYFCALCATPILYLVKGTPLAQLPKRGTDGATALEEAVYLRELAVSRVAPRDVHRPGKGVERQFPLHCPSCDIPIAYRPVPLETPTRFLYILPNALTATKPSRQAAARTAALLVAAAGAAAGPTIPAATKAGAGATTTLSGEPRVYSDVVAVPDSSETLTVSGTQAASLVGENVGVAAEPPKAEDCLVGRSPADDSIGSAVCVGDVSAAVPAPPAVTLADTAAAASVVGEPPTTTIAGGSVDSSTGAGARDDERGSLAGVGRKRGREEAADAITNR